MTRIAGASCCVCGASDARALVEVGLVGGARAPQCGSHALMYRRSSMDARSAADLKLRLSDRRRRSERRTEGDALGQSLSEAFAGDRRAGGQRRG